MKPLLLLLLAAIIAACAAEDTPSAEELREHLERGLSGQGHIVPLDNPEEPIPPPEGRPR
ncbi:MAG TPA: hypothetical protein VGI60_01330 [Chthoniobacterales bacterium]|jgi:hypothetical protein